MNKQKKTDSEVATATTTPTSLEIPAFGGSREKRWTASSGGLTERYDGQDTRGVRRGRNEMDMALIIQDKLIAKALEESGAFPEAASESVRTIKDAPRYAPQLSETVMGSKEDRRKVKSLRFHETVSIIDPATGDRFPQRVGFRR